jgi:staphylococcal nuclease domain-containing protein 1
VKRVVNFSSINLPRIGGPGREDEPYAWEAREFLRSKLIGKRIKATLDYERQLPNATDLRGFYTVYLEKNNISLLLVEKGYAKVVPHKNDEKRSSSYEALVINERKCQKKGKGVHSKPENAPIHRVNDLTAPAGEAKKANEKEGAAPAQKKAPDANKVKQFLPFLKRAGRTPAIVEYVVHAGKFKCFVPKESCIINFVLTGVKVPQRRADASEPFADEALEFVRKKCHQRDVEIEVETQDKGGNFIGNMWVGRKLFAVSILEEGLASVNAGSASHSGYSADLFGAEDRAKRAKKNVRLSHLTSIFSSLLTSCLSPTKTALFFPFPKIWKNYDESQEQQPKQETETEELKPRKEYLSVVVTEVLDGSNFFVNVKSDDLTQLELLMEKAQEWANQMAPGYIPAPNDKVLAQFPADNKWYRGRLIGKSAGDQYKVSFVDFGNVSHTSSAFSS